MSKIPFTLDAWLKDKSQRVEARDGRIVHNIWPVEPIIVCGKKADVCALIDGEEDALVFFEGGKYLPANAESHFDLFIVTPELELSEFEHAFGLAIVDAPEPEEKEEWYPYVKEKAAELLDIARKEALKDMPRWEKYPFNAGDEPVVNGIMQSDGSYEWRIYLNGYKIEISDLKKLPGFKED